MSSMTRAHPTVQDGILRWGDGSTEHWSAIGTPAWYEWLMTATRFAFVGSEGGFTARKERFQRGGWYWRAYHRQGGKLYHAYLGKSEHLTAERLHVVARMLATRMAQGSTPALRATDLSTSDAAGRGALQIPGKPLEKPYHFFGDQLLATRLQIPPVRPTLIPRPRLTTQLDRVMDVKLLVLAAPAGSGKTTLLSDWSASQASQVAWVTLDPQDNDPARFWKVLLAAFAPLKTEEQQTQASLYQTRPGASETVLPSVIHTILQQGQDVVLVLDDYHLLTHPAIHADLQWLLERPLPSLHVVLSTRAAPPFSLARLRLQGQVREVEATDLHFTEEEVAAFFTQTHPVPLSSEEQRTLADATEGWVAGLQLAALALSKQQDRTNVLRAFTHGRQPTLVDYLEEEVLQQQPPVLQTFLVQTAVLGRLSGPLCDAVTARTDGQAMLEYLERSHLFLIPLDSEQGWYRYHALFAEFLQARLQPEQLPALHRRAAAWYEGEGLLREAIGHALASGDGVLAARLVAAVALEVLQGEEYETLLGWMADLSQEEINVHPTLGVRHALALALTGHLNEATARLEMLERQLAEEEPCPAEEQEDAGQTLRGQVAMVQGQIAFHRDNYALTIERYQEALAHLPMTQPYLRVLSASRMGWAYDLLGQTQQSLETFAQARIEGQMAKDTQTSWVCLYHQGMLQRLHGRLAEAVETFQQALHLVPVGAVASFPETDLAAMGLGLVFYEWDDLDAAASFLQQGLVACQRLGNIFELVRGWFLLGRLRHWQQDQEGFQQVLECLEQSSRSPRLALRHAARARAWHARLCLLDGRLNQARRWAATCEAQRENAPVYPFEASYLTLARVLLAEGQAETALPLLERLVAAQATAERTEPLIESLILYALALEGKGQTPAALRALTRALSLAEPGGYLRLFADEGAPLVALLEKLIRAYNTRALPRSLPISRSYLRRVLDASRASAALSGAAEQHAAGEPLSEREREIIQLLATGLSNQQIADELVLDLSTVKWHLKSIYRKLGSHSRLQAVTRARTLQVL